MKKRCVFCEFEKYEEDGEDVQTVEIRDPEIGKNKRRDNFCAKHRDLFHKAGYYVRTVS